MALQKLPIGASEESMEWELQTSEKVKILWDFSIQTDHQLEHNRPDLVEVAKQRAVCQIIDVAVPGDPRVELKKKEKVDEYQNPTRELRKLWKVKQELCLLWLRHLGQSQND